jgi:hypothetical protein
MTSPIEAAADQMAADNGAGEDGAVMLERVPVPAGPLSAENPAFPAPSAIASPSARWHEFQAVFVDDPRSSAEMAAGLVEESVQALVASVREQQDSLLAAWHGENADRPVTPGSPRSASPHGTGGDPGAPVNPRPCPWNRCPLRYRRGSPAGRVPSPVRGSFSAPPCRRRPASRGVLTWPGRS